MSVQNCPSSDDFRCSTTAVVMNSGYEGSYSSMAVWVPGGVAGIVGGGITNGSVLGLGELVLGDSGATLATGVVVCVCSGIGGSDARTSRGGIGNVLVVGVGCMLVRGIDSESVMGVIDLSVGGVGGMLVGGSGVVGELWGLLCAVSPLEFLVGQLVGKHSWQVLSCSPI